MTSYKGTKKWAVRHLWRIGLLAIMAVAACTSVAQARQFIPTHNCSASAMASYQQGATLSTLNSCRRKQGLSDLRLPRNWIQLPASEQLFTLINLERISRKLPPIIGMTEQLNQVAHRSAYGLTNPVWHQGWYTGAWGENLGPNSKGQGVISADFYWMYNDGWWSRGRPHSFNSSCTSQHSPLCWGHARSILTTEPGPLVMGASARPSRGSYSFIATQEMVGNPLTFSWTTEKRYLYR